MKAHESMMRPAPDYWNLGEGMGAYLDAYTRAVEPVTSTIPELDEMTRGGFRPGVHFIGGNTGAGKSAFCIWMAERIASCADPETGRPYGVTYISLELGATEVRSRMGSRLSYALDSLEPFRWADFERLGRDMRRMIEDGTYDPAHDPVYCADLELMAHCPNVRIVDSIGTAEADTISYICQEIAFTGSRGGRAVFVDYLQCIDAGTGLDEQESMKASVRALNLAGMRAGVAVIVIAAVNRAKGSEMRRGKRGENPGADIFRGSSWIEYTGLTAFALVRREDAARTGDFVEVELYPVKNRRGECAEPVRLAYAGAYGEFSF